MSTEAARQNDPIFLRRQKFIDAAKASDIAGMIALADDEVVIMSPNDSTVYGKAEWQEWLEEYFQYFRFAAFTEPNAPSASMATSPPNVRRT